MIQFKRGKTREWIAKMNHMEKLAPGQPGYDTDRRKMKIGDGKKTWIELPYAGGLNAEEILDSEKNAKNRFSAFDKLLVGLGNLIGLDFSNDKVAIMTYGEEYPDEHTVGQLYLQHYDAEPEADYIVDYGNADGWTFQKWYSGIAKCWRTFEIRTRITNEHETTRLFYANNVLDNQNYPFTFVNTSGPPTETASLKSFGGIVWLGSNNAESDVYNKSSAYSLISFDRQANESNYLITIEVSGYWR